MNSIAIVKGLGGNGSTFICRALAAMERVVLLSETNPLSANLFAFELNPALQIARNYKQHGFAKYDGHMAELGAPAFFRRYITQLSEACALRGLALVIRDYNYVDYVGTPFAWPAARKSSLDNALRGLPRKEIVLIRHPLAQFLSLISHKELERALDHRAFLKGYRRLLDTTPSAVQFKYETVFGKFDREFAAIVAALGIDFDGSFRSRLPATNWITGHAGGKARIKPEKPAGLSARQRKKFRSAFLDETDYNYICKTYRYRP